MTKSLRATALLFICKLFPDLATFESLLYNGQTVGEPVHMNQAFLDEMKQALLSEKKELEAELSRFAHRNIKSTSPDFDSNFPDFGDDEDENATEVAAYSNNLSLESELEKALRDVHASLKRIEDGAYGICQYCKAEIAEARLRARPTSTSCIACKKTLTQEV